MYSHKYMYNTYTNTSICISNICMYIYIHKYTQNNMNIKSCDTKCICR